MEFFPELAIILRIGSFELHWYSLTMFLGIAFGYWHIGKQMKKYCGYDQSFFDDLYFYCILVGIAGARLWYVLFSPDNYLYFKDPLSVFKTWEGGLAIQGVIVAVALFLIFYLKKKKMDPLRFFDLAMPTMLFSQAIGRWGNFFNQEAYGTVVSENFYKYFPQFIKVGMFIDGQYRLPTFLLEAFFNILGFILIYTVIKKYLIKKRGDYAYWYLLWTGVVRFFIEIYRTDNLMIGSLKSAQVVSVLYVLIAFCGFFGFFDKLLKKPKPLILFDLDGTIVDSRQVITNTFNALFKKYKMTKQLSLPESDEVFGPPLQANLLRLFPQQELETVYRDYVEINNHLQAEGLPLRENAEALLRYLQENAYQVGLVTNKTRAGLETSLKASGVLDYFTVTVGIDEVKNPKPHKEAIILAAQKVACGLDAIIMVGDSVDDIRCGKNARVFTIAYQESPRREAELLAQQPNRYIADLLEIKEILKEQHSWTIDMM